MSANRTGIPSRESTAEQQVATALSVLHALMPYVLAPHREPGKEIKELDGGTECAAAMTFIKACNRLDTMLDDPGRWKLDEHDKLYDSMVRTHEAQQVFMKAQTDAANIVQRPSYQLRPTLAIDGDNQYIALWGDMTKAGCALIGRGKTPADALTDFDAAFHRMPNEQFVIIAESVENAAAVPTVKRKKK